jgi:hypothetical protein
VNAIRRRRYRTVKSGQLPGKPTSAPWSRSVFLGSIRPEIGRPIRGARGDHYPPRYRQENRGRLPRALSARYRRCWRSVTAPAATIPLTFRAFTSAPGNRGSTVAPGLDGEHRGGIASVSGTALRMEPGSAGTVPLTGQLRPHQRSMANIGTACVRVADYARPATLPQHHRHRSRGYYVRSGEA